MFQNSISRSDVGEGARERERDGGGKAADNAVWGEAVGVQAAVCGGGGIGVLLGSGEGETTEENEERTSVCYREESAGDRTKTPHRRKMSPSNADGEEDAVVRRWGGNADPALLGLPRSGSTETEPINPIPLGSTRIADRKLIIILGESILSKSNHIYFLYH